MADIRVWNLDEVIESAIAVLASGEGSDKFPLIDGRVVAVQTTPVHGTSQDMAMGVSALPSNYSTPEHTHRAEEFAMVVHGSGTITIEDVPVPVTSGSVVVTPPHARHVTTAGPDGPMAVFWVYGPAGSERRWLERH